MRKKEARAELGVKMENMRRTGPGLVEGGVSREA